jgi:hypothetical protein
MYYLTPFLKGNLLFLLCKINKKDVNFEIPVQEIRGKYLKQMSFIRMCYKREIRKK